MLDLLSLPPRLVARALDDLHTLAEGMRRLTEDGRLDELVQSVRVLPATEDQLSANIDALRGDVRDLRARLDPLGPGLGDVDDTAEALERALATLQTSVDGLRADLAGFHAEIRDLRDRIPGI